MLVRIVAGEMKPGQGLVANGEVVVSLVSLRSYGLDHTLQLHLIPEESDKQNWLLMTCIRQQTWNDIRDAIQARSNHHDQGIERLGEIIEPLAKGNTKKVLYLFPHQEEEVS